MIETLQNWEEGKFSYLENEKINQDIQDDEDELNKSNEEDEEILIDADVQE